MLELQEQIEKLIGEDILYEEHEITCLLHKICLQYHLQYTSRPRICKKLKIIHLRKKGDNNQCILVRPKDVPFYCTKEQG